VSSAEDLLDLGAEPAPPVHRGDTAEIPLVVEEDEVTEPPLAPIRSPEPKGGTLISTPDEAQDLRRRISMPSADFDVNLEAIEEEEDEIEEISLESDPLPPLRRAVLPSPGPLPAPPRAPVPAPAATPPRPASPAPIEVEVEARSAQAEVSVPIELSLEPGTTQVNLSLRLILKIKPPR
jgi:hypothetical protein